MTSVPKDLKFIETHEYIRVDDDIARIGISEFAATQLGDIVFVELPEVGQTLEKGDTFGSIESVKAASDLYMPVTGEITGINSQLTSEPELINNDPYGDGWLIEITVTKAEELDQILDAAQYDTFLADAEG
jgi:glycine cleavage system H protein